jgi:hypothetical protein
MLIRVRIKVVVCSSTLTAYNPTKSFNDATDSNEIAEGILNYKSPARDAAAPGELIIITKRGNG